MARVHPLIPEGKFESLTHIEFQRRAKPDTVKAVASANKNRLVPLMLRDGFGEGQINIMLRTQTGLQGFVTLAKRLVKRMDIAQNVRPTRFERPNIDTRPTSRRRFEPRIKRNPFLANTGIVPPELVNRIDTTVNTGVLTQQTKINGGRGIAVVDPNRFKRRDIPRKQVAGAPTDIKGLIVKVLTVVLDSVKEAQARFPKPVS